MEQNSLMQICGICGTKVLPTQDRRCPACEFKLESPAVASPVKQKGHKAVNSHMEELVKKIEARISDLDRQTSRLSDDLQVVRQATAIAKNFEGAHGNKENLPEEPFKTPEF